MNKRRDDFSKATALQLAKRAGWLCSFPACRKPTVGATADGQGEINRGTAAHICAAAPGGPRYDASMSAVERRSANNGIWLCRDHGKAIDSDVKEFTTERLREWKRLAEEDSWRRVLGNEAAPALTLPPQDDSRTRLRCAAQTDLAVFRKTARWPRTSVALTLKVEGYDKPATTTALARAVRTLDDLILIASPGMGKTTTLFQIAEGLLEGEGGIPVIIPLGDWATENVAILDSILKRPAYRNLSEADFRAAATLSGVVLLLDGWNELNADARERARVQVEALKAELPELGLVVSTRKQVLDVPFPGKLVELMSLNDEQQVEIAKAMRGEAGAMIVDQAWRTEGVRELVSIPLYLVALLFLPGGEPFPRTKEEILRRFVTAHEKDPRRAEALRAVAKGFQQDFLGGLAVFATQSANTAITDFDARRSISETAAQLVTHGQITTKPEPDAVLAALVDNHVLVHAGDTSGVSFQHQQFQEWYASHEVERQIMASAADRAGIETLKAEIFNFPTWEEAILFAIERMTRGEVPKKAACVTAILAAFEVDPLLAAEMIYRATDEIWASVASTLQERIEQWHAPGKCDRALRFMMNSGRPEFLDRVWPLITHENDQVSLKALRNCRRFRTSLLGPDAVKRIQSLPPQRRLVLLYEMARHGEMDGLDLATAIATDDPDPEVQASVAEVLSFRRADRHLAALLKNAEEATFDLIVRNHVVDDVSDEGIRQGIASARERQAKDGDKTGDRLRTIAFASDGEDRSADLVAIISEMELLSHQDAAVHLIYEARNRYPRAVAEGLLARVRTDRALFYGVDDILASEGFDLEDDALLQIALTESQTRDARAEAAASVLGPRAAGRLIDAVLDIGARLRYSDGTYDKEAVDRYHQIATRIAHLPGGSLVAAVQARSAQATNEQMARLAELLSRRSDGRTDSCRPFRTEDLAAIRALAADWGNRMLASGNTERRHMAKIAVLASHASDASLLPLLKRLLDENLRRYRAYRAEAESAGWRDGNAVSEAREPMTHEYQRAFLAIDAPENTALMCEYLTDMHFGELAAGVLTSQWQAVNEPPRDERFFGGVDFSCVKEKRAAHTADPAATSLEAEAILGAIEPLIAEGSTDEQRRRAVSLGIQAVRLPHGQRQTTIEALVALSSRRERPKLLQSLILSGEELDAKLVVGGIAETFEAANEKPWILTQSDGYELREWLRLLPFTNRPSVALEVARGMPAAQRHLGLLEEMVSYLAETPSDGSEEVLFKLAEEDPRFYQNYRWREAALKVGTTSSALRLVGLTANGALSGESLDGWRWARELAALIGKFPEVRSHVYALLRDKELSQPLVLLARAVAESPDAEGILLLSNIENKQNLSLLGWRAIEKVVTEYVPVENWSGAYNVVSIPVPELRRRLLAETSDGGSTDAAARCLNTIDIIRDEHGVPLSEPRHPDLASGMPWPIMVHDPDATAYG